VSRNLSFSSVRSVSVGFFYIAHYRTLHIALVFFCLLVFYYYHSWWIKISIMCWILIFYQINVDTRILTKKCNWLFFVQSTFLQYVWNGLICVSIQRNPHAFPSVPVLAWSAVTFDNCKLSWSDKVRYLWIYLRSSRTFSCSCPVVT